MGGLILVGLAALVYWLNNRRPTSRNLEHLEADPELQRKGLRLGRDYAWYVREGRPPVVRINSEGRKRLQQMDKQKKRKKFRVFDDV